ncbi:hypothetical protein BDR26DRAFT_275548 [Obelidium mucronatum]|nr:hypothetical protein BDR26DRAFT_275548 [Obelidium mucronatum]
MLPPEKEALRIKAQRKVMMYCALMASTLVIFLLPAAFLGSIYDDEAQRTIIMAMIALDGIINPLLIIFFMPNIRRSLLSFGKRASDIGIPFQRNDVTSPEVENETERLGVTECNAPAINPSSQGFVVLRVQEGG